MKRLVRLALESLGYEVRRKSPSVPGADTRGIGNLTSFFEDIRARKFDLRSVLDCGANAGKWSLELLKVYPEAKVLMIEPQEKMRESLQKVVDRYPEARLHIGAVGGKNEKALFSMWPDPTGSTFLDKRDEKAVEEGRQVMMELKTIPGILSETGFAFPQLIKMDIQGLELSVLKGMEKDLHRVEALILECNLFPFLGNQPIAHEILNFLSERDFLIYDICGFGRRPKDGALSHIDFVFAPAQGFLRRYQGW